MSSCENRGKRGCKGHTGKNGILGSSGFTGPTGATGLDGIAGSAGSIGYTGATGINGLQGAPGITGLGFTGPAGFAGATGPSAGGTGPIGPTGSPGMSVIGNTGPVGATGSPGISLIIPGATGPTGPAGPSLATPGAQGLSGPTGRAGLCCAPAGPPGTTGIIGPQGPAGNSAPGPAGFGFYSGGVVNSPIRVSNRIVTPANQNVAIISNFPVAANRGHLLVYWLTAVTRENRICEGTIKTFRFEVERRVFFQNYNGNIQNSLQQVQLFQTCNQLSNDQFFVFDVVDPFSFNLNVRYESNSTAPVQITWAITYLIIDIGRNF